MCHVPLGFAYHGGKIVIKVLRQLAKKEKRIVIVFFSRTLFMRVTDLREI